MHGRRHAFGKSTYNVSPQRIGSISNFMSATSIQFAPPVFSPYLSQQLRRFAPLAAVIGLHVAFFYALQSGLLHQAVKAVMPKEIQVSLISEEPAPKPQPAPPKAVPIVKKTTPRPTPAPVVTRTPSPRAITEEVTPPKESQEPPSAVASPAPAAPAAPATPATPKMVSGIEYIERPNPVVPAASVRMGEEGIVNFKVLVNIKGKAEKVDIIKSSGFPRLDDAAVNAVKRALFKPYIEDGKAVAVSTTGSIAFNISR
jgi:protein TonB